MKKKFLIGLLFCFCAQAQSFSDIDIVPGILPQAETVNTHDLQTLRKFEAEQQIKQDYGKHKQTIKEKKEQAKAKVEKAKIEEYATKGVYVENIEVSPSQILTVYEIESIIDDYTKTNDIPNCYFEKIDPEHKHKGMKIKDFAKFVIENGVNL